MNILRRSLLFLLCATACLCTASANTITETSTLSLTPTDFFYDDIPANVFTLHKFNTSLGTLNSVSLTFHLTATYDLQLAANNTAATFDPGFQIGVQASVQGPNGGILDSTLADTFASTAHPGSLTIPKHTTDPTHFSNGAGSPVTIQRAITPSSWNQWSGNPLQTVTMQIQGLDTFSGTSHGSFVIVGEGHVAGDVTVSYDYTASSVPEPGTIGLLGSGLLAAAFFARKRR